MSCKKYITFFNYDLSEDGFVNITIYDMLGNVVDNLVNTYQYAGYKSINWDATNHKGYRVSAGIYLYSIVAGDFIKTKKMILIK
jgi:flagellar hook assembly protein FlgD